MACIFKLLITAGNALPRFPDGRARQLTMARREPFVESKLTIFSGGSPHAPNHQPDCGDASDLQCRWGIGGHRVARRLAIVADAAG